MRHSIKIAVYLIAISMVGTLAIPAAFADEKDLGKHSQDEIRKACNAVGGDLLGVSELGSYGCENPSKGTMVLCNKAGNCTGLYAPSNAKPAQQALERSRHKGETRYQRDQNLQTTARGATVLWRNRHLSGSQYWLPAALANPLLYPAVNYPARA
jgi:hypothetical protein